MIRTATPGEIPVIHAMVRELAEYEKVPDEAKASRQHLHEALFGEQPAAFAHIAEAAGEPVDFALWFVNYPSLKRRACTTGITGGDVSFASSPTPRCSGWGRGR
jgi:hypothetical protein